MPKVPPLNPLRVFEVVARTQNLTVAAAELCVGQSAVSRQIGVLENYLGVPLFRRERLGVRLTAAGSTYARQIAPAFKAIAAATEQITRRADPGVVRVRAYTTFTAKWLIPHLPDFKQRHPDIEIAISNAVPDVDFERDAVDVAIQFGDGRWRDVQAQLLVPDEIEPVCAPACCDRLVPGTDTPAALLGGRLLVSRYRRTDWDDWLGASGFAAQAEHAERMIFSSSVLTWQAALDGLGIAIGQRFLLASDLAAGRLMRPFAQPLRRAGLGHYLVMPAALRPSRSVDAFGHWICEAIAADGTTRGAQRA